MAKPNADAFMAEWTKTHGPLDMPGAMLMKYGPEDYVGATIAVRGTLYFKGSHTPEGREALCKCFDAYKAIANDHLKWLWRDEPPSGPDKYPYAKAPQLREMVKKMDEEDHFGFTYTGGEKPHDASAWMFSTFGRRAWQARMGTWGPDSLIFSVPKEVVEANPTLFQKLFVEFCKLLKAEHGHGGFALNLSAVRGEPNEPTEAVMVSKMAGLDAGTGHLIGGLPGRDVEHHLVTVGWLTAINHAMVEKVGGLSSLRSELPASWFAKYDYGNGIVIQAGPEPEIAPVELDPKPAIYVLPAIALKEVRLMADLSLHYGSKDGEPRLTGLAAKEWLTRFDVPEDELMRYKTKLLNEPKLSKETTLPDSL
ncbi:type VI immunity family protein [Massilia sp. TSP1-1-2]|uniref:type VI immunity family protein n=1 Tax=Massilia sp. TSP1-1-2 TaxID=2804649 RepID=UPI003CEACABB